MNRIKNFIGLILLLFPLVLAAQSEMSWKKHLKTADDLFKQARYADAAEHYKEAWKQKTKNKELIYKAGESYYIIKDYKNAADAFSKVKEDYKDYPLVGLKYARALKQAGDYDAAGRELVYFLNNYKGSDKDIISEIVQNEIRGSELGIKLSTIPDTNIEIQHLNSNVNTPETEFAPFAFNDETIYYSSTMAARAEIYRSRKVDGSWTKPERPNGFPQIDADHFCNGNLSPDGKRFYFTICKSKESWGGLTTECDLYLIKNNNNKWGSPIRLRDYVNLEGSTSTHPFVVHQDDTELLYFSSNRAGGKGGMDIWYMTRDLRSDDIDFSFPINCGSSVNSKGDEITPFYDKEEGTLYFASNGAVTIGGFDIFKISGNRSQWDQLENVGTPINSSADDFFFVRTPSRNGGFFASNRLFGAEKISTTDEDIFSFTDTDAAPKITVKGQVLDAKNSDILTGVMVSISQFLEGGRKQFIANKRFAEGEYFFEVLPGAEYELEAQRDGYLPKKYVFSTREEGMRTAGKTIKMDRMWAEEADYLSENRVVNNALTPDSSSSPEQKVETKDTRVNISPTRKENPPAVSKETKIVTAPVNKPKVETSQPKVTTAERPKTQPTNTYVPSESVVTPAPSPSTSSSVSGSSYVTSEAAPYTIDGITSSAPRHEGTYYKIQLIAVVRHDPGSSRYNSVRGMARMDTELIESKNVIRVLLADYFSYADAKKALGKVRAKRGFERAYMVKYRDGARVGRVK